jgi:hypothetical protein
MIVCVPSPSNGGMGQCCSQSPPARLGFIWDERACLLRASRLDFLSRVVSRRLQGNQIYQFVLFRDLVLRSLRYICSTPQTSQQGAGIFSNFALALKLALGRVNVYFFCVKKLPIYLIRCCVLSMQPHFHLKTPMLVLALTC